MTEKNRFQDGKIYTIRYRLDNSLIYVGSTTQTLCKRWGDHKSCYNTCQDKSGILLYQKIKETSDLHNWYIELYELFPCNSRMELLQKEGQVIREIATLNKIISGRTDKEYRLDNKEQLLKNKKDYYISNKEILLKQHKEYREINKEIITEKKKIYYEKNRETNLKQRTEKINCCCGKLVSKCNLAKHQKTQAHLDFLENKPIE